MKKRFLFIFSFLILLFLIYFFLNINTFHIKITLKIENLNAKEIEKQIVKKVENEILLLEDVKDVVSISKDNECIFYIKINFFALDKEKVKNEIFKEIFLLQKIFDRIVEIDFDDKYSQKYDYFLVLSEKNNDYFNLDKKSEKILEEVLLANFSKNIKELGILKKALYVKYSNNNLANYNLSLSDIKNIIEKNNLNLDLIKNNNNENHYSINFDGKIKNIEDVKNIPIFYKGEQFSMKFGDIFEINKEIKKPNDSYIFLNDKNAIVFAISKKNYIPFFIMKYKIENIMKNYQNELDFKIIKPNSLKVIQIYLNKNNNIEYSKKIYLKIQNHLKALALISTPGAKFNNRQDFLYDDRNRIILFLDDKNYKMFKNYAKENNISYSVDLKGKYIYFKNLNNIEKELNNYLGYFNVATQKNTQIHYKIDDFLMNDYKLTKKDIFESLNGQFDGLYCGYYFDNYKKIEIILKNLNRNEEPLVFSKRFKNLLNLSSIVKSELSYDFSTIAKWNKKYFIKLLKIN